MPVEHIETRRTIRSSACVRKTLANYFTDPVFFCPRPNIGSRRVSHAGQKQEAEPAWSGLACFRLRIVGCRRRLPLLTGPGWILAGGAVIPSDARSRPACSNWLRRTGGVAAQARAGLGVGGEHGQRDLPALDVQVGHRPRRVGEASDAAASATVHRCPAGVSSRRRPCFHGDRSRWRSPTGFADRARLCPCHEKFWVAKASSCCWTIACACGATGWEGGADGGRLGSLGRLGRLAASRVQIHWPGLCLGGLHGAA
jgi:hypothetical protein